MRFTVAYFIFSKWFRCHNFRSRNRTKLVFDVFCSCCVDFLRRIMGSARFLFKKNDKKSVEKSDKKSHKKSVQKKLTKKVTKKVTKTHQKKRPKKHQNRYEKGIKKVSKKVTKKRQKKWQPNVNILPQNMEHFL